MYINNYDKKINIDKEFFYITLTPHICMYLPVKLDQSSTGHGCQGHAVHIRAVIGHNQAVHDRTNIWMVRIKTS